METLIYIGKVSLYWALFYALYQLFLRKQTFFQWNRVYLIGALIVSFALPFVIYPEVAPEMPVAYTVNLSDYTNVQVVEKTTTIFTWTNLLLLSYVIGVVSGIYTLIQSLQKLTYFLKAGETIELDDCTVVLIDSNQIGSFSFLKWIVINRNDYEHYFDNILRHEMVHTSQGHTYDVLFIEVLKIVFWFNPILHLYKNALQEVHEYLADEAAPNKEHYSKFLVSYALNAPIAALTNHFFKSHQIKSRVAMIYKNRSSKWLRSSYIIAFGLTGLVAIVIAGCEKNSDKIDVPEKASAQVQVNAKEDLGKIYTVVENQPEFPGGMVKMYEFLGDNVKYPEAASEKNITGTVFVSFVVSPTGAVSNVQITKGLGYGCDAEVVRVVKNFPKWIPGTQDGKAVSVRYTLPVNFQLEEADKQTSAKSTSSSKSPASVPKYLTANNIDEAVVANRENNIARQMEALDPRYEADKIRFRNDGSSGMLEGVKTNPYINPLYIIDGKEITNFNDEIKKIDPGQIASINILKGEAANSQYGFKGKDGVILIETKDAAVK